MHVCFFRHVAPDDDTTLEERRASADHDGLALIVSRRDHDADLEADAVTFDPEEIVTLYGEGQMTLRSAVRRVMAKARHERIGATIFRDGNPSILSLAQIEVLAGDLGIAST